jgi:hypothetical protein
MSNTSSRGQGQQVTVFLKADIPFVEDPPRGPFLSLPRELKDNTYHYYFEELFAPFEDTWISYPQLFNRYTDIFFVNRQIYDEATEVFYGHYYPRLYFQFWNSNSIVTFFMGVGGRRLNFKGQLRLVYKQSRDGDRSEGRAISSILIQVVKIVGWDSVCTWEEALKENNNFWDAVENDGPGLRGKALYLYGQNWKMEVRYANDGPCKCLQLDGDIGRLFPFESFGSGLSDLDYCMLA